MHVGDAAIHVCRDDWVSTPARGTLQIKPADVSYGHLVVRRTSVAKLGLDTPLDRLGVENCAGFTKP